jgi:hypothetical protein
LDDRLCPLKLRSDPFEPLVISSSDVVKLPLGHAPGLGRLAVVA